MPAEDATDRVGMVPFHRGDVEPELKSRAPPGHPDDAPAEAFVGQGFAIGRRGQGDPGVGVKVVDVIGIDQGPIVAMIANHRNGVIWQTMQRQPALRRGLARAGFAGGWLG